MTAPARARHASAETQWGPHRLRYAGTVIKDQKSYRLLRELEDTRALQALTIEESIAIGEALLTSSIMTLVRPTRERRLDLARTLGVRPERLQRPRRPR